MPGVPGCTVPTLWILDQHPEGAPIYSSCIEIGPFPVGHCGLGE